MFGIFKKLFKRKNKPINGDDNSVFEIFRSVEMKDGSVVICGVVKSGRFRTGDRIAVCGHIKKNVKLRGVIQKITTSLVEVNNISKGIETDIMLTNIQDDNSAVLPGDKAYKVLRESGVPVAPGK